MDPFERLRELDPELYALIRHEVGVGVLGGTADEEINARVRSAILADPALLERFTRAARRAGWVPGC